VRVVIDGRLILPQMTGIGRYLCGLVQALRDLPGDARFELWIQPDLPPRHPVRRLTGGSLVLREVPIPHMSLRQQWALPLMIRRCRPHLFHYPHFDLPIAVPGLVVVTIHDLKYIARPAFFPHFGWGKRLLMWAMMMAATRRARRVIAVSESTRWDILHYLRADPRKVVVIQEGVDEAYFRQPSERELERVRSCYGLDTPFVLFVGERRPHKNIVGLLHAFRAFRERGYGAYHLLVVGKRYADYQKPEKMVEALSLREVVHFLDHVPEADLPVLYRLADAFVLLSLYEGFGLPILEAMASGTPVVAARSTSLPEVVGDAGMLVDPKEPEAVADALSLVVRGGHQRDTCIARGLQRASQFRWRRCAEETMSVYREVTS